MDNDRPLTEDIAEQKREVQSEIDNNVRLRAELNASNIRLAAMDAQIAAGAQESRDIIGTHLRQYLDPSQPNPDARLTDDAPPLGTPSEEPPVFTTVDSADLGGGTTSGGSAIVADDFTLPVFPDAAPAPAPEEKNTGGSEVG